jgi:hypothetical protein
MERGNRPPRREQEGGSVVGKERLQDGLGFRADRHHARLAAISGLVLHGIEQPDGLIRVDVALP